MTLKDQITADASTVFLNEDDFATEVTRWVGGDANNTITLVANVDWDNEPGRNEMPGDGVTIDEGTGRKLRRTCRLDVALSVLSDPPLTPHKDKFDLGDGELVTFLRVEGRDGGMATLICVKREDMTSKRPHLRP